MEKTRYAPRLGAYDAVVAEAVNSLLADHAVSRLWGLDHTLWKPTPTEISNRLGWLRCPHLMPNTLPLLYSFADDIRKKGFAKALLLGMGGSSLAPELFAKVFGIAHGHPELRILDSTDPGALLREARTHDPRTTLYIVSTKSGGTVETFSLLKYFYNEALTVLGAEQTGRHFIAITDPGSEIQKLGEKLGFRKVFLGDPDIGGRYSVLSLFGLVPAAIIGVDVSALLSSSQDGAAAASMASYENGNTPLHLGAAMGALALKGRDKLTLLSSDTLHPFGAWAEQLVAESTGKEGKGILPVVGSVSDEGSVYGDDRFVVVLALKSELWHHKKIERLEAAGQPFICIELPEKNALGEEFFRWEAATAFACALLKVNPFDQPNVESAKVQARGMLARYKVEGSLPQLTAACAEDGITAFAPAEGTTVAEVLTSHLSAARANSFPRPYVAVHAYVTPDQDTDGALDVLRAAIQKKYSCAVTAGYGPRFLHSTGQLHKGDAGNGLFVQLLGSIREDAPVPDDMGSADSSFTFGIIRNAQALGDRQALAEAGRRVLTFGLEEDTPHAILSLAARV